MSVVVTPRAHEMFTPGELADAYGDFEKRAQQEGALQPLEAANGLRLAAYQFGERVLIAYEESEDSVVVLIHPTS